MAGACRRGLAGPLLTPDGGPRPMAGRGMYGAPAAAARTPLPVGRSLPLRHILIHHALPDRSAAGAGAVEAAGPATGGGANSRATPAVALDWYPLVGPDLWQGTEAAALRPGTPLDSLSPAWKVLLLSDGSVTRHLQLLTGAVVDVDVLDMTEMPPGPSPGAPALPPTAVLLAGPLLQRRVLLRAAAPPGAPAGPALVYAASWWNVNVARDALKSPGLPIWASLSASRCELYREIVSVHAGAAPAALGTALGAPPGSRLWGRHYLFWRGGVPLTAIYEVFSPSLEQYVGTACAAAASGRQG